MKTIAITFAVLIASAVSASAQISKTGNQMKDICEFATRGPKAEGFVLAKATFCQGYVMAFLAIGPYLPGPFTFCLPAGVTVDQAINAFLKYLDDNPSDTHKNAEYLIGMAFATAWPCR